MNAEYMKEMSEVKEEVVVLTEKVIEISKDFYD